MLACSTHDVCLRKSVTRVSCPQLLSVLHHAICRRIIADSMELLALVASVPDDHCTLRLLQ